MSESTALNPLTWPVLQRQDPSFQLETLCLDFQMGSGDACTTPFSLALPLPTADTVITPLWLFLWPRADSWAGSPIYR